MIHPSPQRLFRLCAPTSKSPCPFFATRRAITQFSTPRPIVYRGAQPPIIPPTLRVRSDAPARKGVWNAENHDTAPCLG